MTRISGAEISVPSLAPELEVMIEIPRGSFVKRGSTDRVDFVSPFPCPFNYGAVPTLLGLEGDLLDAVVLGPRLARGASVRARAWGAVTLMDRGMCDDKVICKATPVDDRERALVVRFFRRYAFWKGVLNMLRRQPGKNACMGWVEAQTALARARPRTRDWRGPDVRF